MNSLRPPSWVYDLYKTAAQLVPAYKPLAKLSARQIHTSEDVLRHAPVIDKKSYISKHTFTELSVRRNLAPLMHASSGSSGVPTYWLRSFAQEHAVALDRQAIFEQYFGFKKTENTLVIVAFGMGVWVAGSMEAAACKILSEKYNWRITVVTPGIEKKDIAAIFKHVAREYTNIVLVGFPAFIMDALHYCMQQGVSFNHRFRLLLAGEAISESFRESFMQLIQAPAKQGLAQVINIYGSADAGQVAFETPLTIRLRSYLLQHPELWQDVFGQTAFSAMPAIYQWNPDHIYIESYNGELLLTAATGIPLVRYNIHDQGIVRTGKDIAGILPKRTDPDLIRALRNTPFPFVTHAGRTDVAVSYYAINIYPAHILTGLQVPALRSVVTQSYFTRHVYTKNHSKETWELYVEVKKGVSKKMVEKIQETVADTLKTVSIEYRKLYNSVGRQALPKIIPVIDIQRIPARIYKHGMLYIHGKKPKMLA